MEHDNDAIDDRVAQAIFKRLDRVLNKQEVIIEELEKQGKQLDDVFLLVHALSSQDAEATKVLTLRLKSAADRLKAASEAAKGL